MFTIRPLTPQDADAYIALRREMTLDSPWAFSICPEDAHDPGTVGIGEAKTGNTIIGAWSADGRLVGSAGVVRDKRIKLAHIALIWGVYVLPGERGKGIARRLVSHAIETARSWGGVTSLKLSVSENSPTARKVYESLGFRAWGTEPDALRTGGRSFADIHLFLAI